MKNERHDYTLLVSEAGARAGVDASYLRAQIRAGKIDAELKSPRLYLVSVSSFNEWLSNRKRSSAAAVLPPEHRFHIPLDQEQIRAFCQKHFIRRLALFGSILTDQFRPDSDVDVLVDFIPGREPGLFGMAGMEIELTQMLGREVDLRTPMDLSPYFRDDVLREADVQYAA